MTVVLATARRRAVALAGLAGLFAALTAGPAAAVDFVVRSDVLFAWGDIKNGDQYEFKKVLAAAGGDRIRIVDLNSNGGFVYAAGEIARTIREKHLTTFVDASRSYCHSACTILFAGGERRFYVNAEGIPDGPTKRTWKGLGYHAGSSSDSRDPDHYSGSGTGLVIGYLYELGVPKAADLTTAAPPDAVYMLSGPKALELGIATDLGRSGAARTERGRSKKSH